jgi:hypothetical protein
MLLAVSIARNYPGQNNKVKSTNSQLLGRNRSMTS